jgi:DNA-binding transcriptional ArsR family regulator
MNVTTFKALADPNRLRIIELLREEPCSVNQVVERLQIRQPQASKHLHTLCSANLVTVQPVAQQRVYMLNQFAFLDLDEWLNSFNRYWRSRMESLEAHLENSKER